MATLGTSGCVSTDKGTKIAKNQKKTKTKTKTKNDRLPHNNGLNI